MQFKITLHEIEQTEKKFIHFGVRLTLPYKIIRTLRKTGVALGYENLRPGRTVDGCDTLA